MAQPALPRAESPQSAGALRALLISGLVLALPGGLLPLWGYHIQPDFGRAGDYFLAVGGGVAAGGVLARWWGKRLKITFLLSLGCLLASAAPVALAFAAPPASVWMRFSGLGLAGLAAGLVNTAIFDSIGPAWALNAAVIALTGGIYFGAGSVISSVLIAWCFESSNAPRLPAMIAIVPALAGISMLRARIVRPAAPPRSRGGEQEFRSVLAILFALLLFFQFANEWSIAGWLPVFVIDRLGISPQAAVDLLALYWLSLTAGRWGAARLLPHVRRSRLLGAGAFCAFFGCSALLNANTGFGMAAGILVTGAGFSAIYPLAAEKISLRFSSWHSGYFNAMFTFALLGATLAPFLLGHAAAALGLRIVPIAAMIGSCAVLLLLLVIWLGRKVSGN